MGSIAAPWRLQPDDRTGTLVVKFRHAGRQFSRSTGTPDAREAQVAAQRIYDEVVSGRAPVAAPGTIGCARPVDELGAMWLVAEKSRLDESTIREYMLYVNRWQGFFEVVDGISTASGERYWRARLATVKRKTVLKELAALRTMLGWARTHGHITETPVISSPDRHATGTPTKRPHKGKHTAYSEAEIVGVLDKLPDVGRKSRRDHTTYRIRDRFVVAWETGLRPGTLDQLRADDYDAQRGVLAIRDEADKARFGRELPLRPEARAALERSLPAAGGLIFGAHDYTTPLRAAALASGLPEAKAAKISPYDFRHSRLTHLGESSDNLVGIMFLAGHKYASTTSIYMHGSKRAAQDVLNGLSGVPTGYGGQRKEPKGRARKGEKSSDSKVVRGAGVEPARFYPPEPKSGASASSAILASRRNIAELRRSGRGHRLRPFRRARNGDRAARVKRR
ncbi:MAG: tyrosine recombinase XerD subunit [Myxococcales bacterium]|nr:tyrosine recombinase XerD subunit [Myxococcales bacterium]